MDPLNLKPKIGPEKLIQKSITAKLRDRGWFVKWTHGNEFQSGWPDTFACNKRYGSRWIEFKLPKGSKLEESQVEVFTRFGEKRTGVWILTGDAEADLAKLLKPYNWYQHLDCMKVVTRSRERVTPPRPRTPPRIASSGPERQIQEAIKRELEKLGWYCLDTHGNIFSYGFPDIYACHRDYGARWIEVKNPNGYRFTPAQLDTFPLMSAHGCGVWVLDGVGQVDRLFKPPNWYQYLDVMK